MPGMPTGYSLRRTYRTETKPSFYHERWYISMISRAIGKFDTSIHVLCYAGTAVITPRSLEVSRRGGSGSSRAIMCSSSGKLLGGVRGLL